MFTHESEFRKCKWLVISTETGGHLEVTDSHVHVYAVLSGNISGKAQDGVVVATDR